MIKQSNGGKVEYDYPCPLCHRPMIRSMKLDEKIAGYCLVDGIQEPLDKYKPKILLNKFL